MPSAVDGGLTSLTDGSAGLGTGCNGGAEVGEEALSGAARVAFDWLGDLATPLGL